MKAALYHDIDAGLGAVAAIDSFAAIGEERVFEEPVHTTERFKMVPSR